MKVCEMPIDKYILHILMIGQYILQFLSNPINLPRGSLNIARPNLVKLFYGQSHIFMVESEKKVAAMREEMR